MLLTRTPRVVLVTRTSEYDGLLARHATREQARFFLETRGQCLDEVEARHRATAPSRGHVARWRTPYPRTGVRVA